MAAENEEDLRKSWESYMSGKFHAKSLASFQHGAPPDLSKPFRVVAEAADAKVCTTVGDTLSVALLPGGVFAGLPYQLLPEVADAGSRSSRSSETAVKERKLPLILPEPQIDDLVVRVTPPPGYVVGPLPADEVKQFGPMTFSRRFESPGDVITATFRLDTGGGTLTAAEVNAARRELSELAPRGDLSRWVLPVELEYRGAKDFREGRWKQGLHEYLHTAAQNVNLAGPRWHYANALLRAGFGDAARQVARQTVTMEPNSASSYAQLAHVLSHDLVGRLQDPGMDRPGALAAYRKAIELDPSDSVVHTSYAILLEFDNVGRRYSSDGDLSTAIAEYRQARKLAGGLGGCEFNLAQDLFLAGDYAGLDKLCSEFAPTSWRSLQVANEMIQHGVEAAKLKLQQLTDSAAERRVTLIGASDQLNRGRYYPQSLALLRLALAGRDDEPALRVFADSLTRLRRFDETQFAASDPRSVVQQAIIGALAGGKWEERAMQLFSTTSSADDRTSAIASLRALLDGVIKAGRTSAYPPQRLADAVSVFDLAVGPGNEDGCRINGKCSAAPSLNWHWFVVREPAGYRLLAPGPTGANLGVEALRQLDAKRPQVAARWLDSAWDDKPKPKMFDAFSAVPFAQFWVSADHGRPENIRLAATMLAAEAADPSAVLPILLSERKKNDLSPEKLQIDRAILGAYCALHRWKDLLDLLGRFREEHGERPGMLIYKMAALDGLNRREELRQLIAAELAKARNNPADEEFIARMGCNLDVFDPAAGVLLRRAELGTISPLALNELAGTAVCQEPPDIATIYEVLAADSRADRKSRLYPLTRALIYAQQGKAREAHENLLQGLEDRGSPPGDLEWYILGRMAEECDFGDIAAGLYAKLKPPKLPNEHSVYHFAQRRMKKLARK